MWVKRQHTWHGLPTSLWQLSPKPELTLPFLNSYGAFRGVSTLGIHPSLQLSYYIPKGGNLLQDCGPLKTNNVCCCGRHWADRDPLFQIRWMQHFSASRSLRSQGRGWEASVAGWILTWVSLRPSLPPAHPPPRYSAPPSSSTQGPSPFNANSQPRKRKWLYLPPAPAAAPPTSTEAETVVFPRSFPSYVQHGGSQSSNPAFLFVC